MAPMAYLLIKTRNRFYNIDVAHIYLGKRQNKLCASNVVLLLNELMKISLHHSQYIYQASLPKTYLNSTQAFCSFALTISISICSLACLSFSLSSLSILLILFCVFCVVP